MSFLDYAPASPPQGWTLSYTGTVIAILKVLGELHDITWTVVIVFWVTGFVYTIIHAAIRQGRDLSERRK